MEQKNTKKDVIILVAGIIAYIALVVLQSKMSRQGNTSFNGVIAQIQVIISTILVVLASKKGFLTGLILNVVSALFVGMQVVRSAGQGGSALSSLPGVVIPLCTVVTIAIIYMYLSRSKKMHDELVENYEQLIQTNRVIREKDEKLTHLAYYDILTNLPNRQLFIDKLNEHVRDNKFCTVIYTDLDDFKKINDTHGHNTGDIILSNYAERLKTFCGETSFVARIGGDEFAIILDGTYTEVAIVEYVNKLRALIAEPVSAGGVLLHATMSYGIASFPQDGKSSEDIFKCTDVAVFNAKAGGKDRPCFYSQASQYIRM